jgi:hypothetical protein
VTGFDTYQPLSSPKPIPPSAPARAADPATAAAGPGEKAPSFAAGPEPSGPPPAGIPAGWHRVPDTVIDEADLDGLAIIGLSMRGGKHRLDGVDRKEAIGIYRVREGEFDAVVACVAGGVEAAELSHLGAEQACLLARDEVARRLPKLFDPEDLPEDLQKVCQELFETVAARLTRRAGFLGVDPSALSTSLAIAVLDANAAHGSRRGVLTGTGTWGALQVIDDEGYAQAAQPTDEADAEALPGIRGRVFAGSFAFAPPHVLLIYSAGLVEALRDAQVTNDFVDMLSAERPPGSLGLAGQMAAAMRDRTEDRTAIGIWAR